MEKRGITYSRTNPAISNNRHLLSSNSVAVFIFIPVLRAPTKGSPIFSRRPKMLSMVNCSERRPGGDLPPGAPESHMSERHPRLSAPYRPRTVPCRNHTWFPSDAAHPEVPKATACPGQHLPYEIDRHLATKQPLSFKSPNFST